jgi:hypothetical protein
LFTNLAFEDVYPVYVTRPVLSGLPEFNATTRFGNGSSNDWLRRVTIQDFALAPIAPYRVSFPANKHEISPQCNASCSAVRIHPNIEYNVVLPDAWNQATLSVRTNRIGNPLLTRATSGRISKSITPVVCKWRFPSRMSVPRIYFFPTNAKRMVTRIWRSECVSNKAPGRII